MGSTAEFRKAFVTRLKQACDESKLIPPPHKGRQQFIANSLGVAPEAVSKWFKGVAMPRPDKVERLAEILNVDQSWLTFGISPEMDRAERKAHAREVDGAVYLVMGMVSLAGWHIGTPSARDPRATYVDFYATIRGSVYPTHVSLAREVSSGRFEVLLPKEFEDVQTIIVVPAGVGKYHFVTAPLLVVKEHMQRKAGFVQLTFVRIDARYMAGSDQLPRIKSFMEVWA